MPRIALAACLTAMLLLAAPGDAGADRKKAIWGPVTVGATSQFPTYADLGVGIYQYALFWDVVAPTRPADPTNPADPAYAWPAELDFAIAEAQRYGMQVSLSLTNAPGWANGGQPSNWAPTNRRDFADYATAVARRYPSVNLFLIWTEPVIDSHWRPFSKKKTPRRYARLLDAAYGAIKKEGKANKVIGGNTITDGQVRPRAWIQRLRLPNGKPPRMDMWGHNPFSPRKPVLKKRPARKDTADTSDLDSLLNWLDTDLGRGKRQPKLKLFISEWTIPTGHSGRLFGFHGDPPTVANYFGKALGIARKLKRVHTLGWFSLYDEAPTPSNDHMNWGLLTWDGIKKPAYFAYKNG